LRARVPSRGRQRCAKAIAGTSTAQNGSQPIHAPCHCAGGIRASASAPIVSQYASTASTRGILAKVSERDTAGSLQDGAMSLPAARLTG